MRSCMYSIWKAKKMATKLYSPSAPGLGWKKSLSKGNEKPPLVLHTYVYCFLLKIRLSHCGQTTLNLCMISKPSWPKPFYIHQDYINGIFKEKIRFLHVCLYVHIRVHELLNCKSRRTWWLVRLISTRNGLAWQ